MKLKAIPAGLSVGVFFGVSLALLTVISVYTGYMESQLGFLVGVYPYYDINLAGAATGLLDGFIDGFFVGWLLVILYNAFAGCCRKK